MIFISLFLAALAHGACEELAGKYTGLAEPGYSSDFSRLDFRLLDGSRRAEIRLRPEGASADRVLSLELDGRARPGDGDYTGEEYRAFCENEALTVEARFSGRSDPLFYYFYRDERELRLINAVGNYARITGRFLPREEGFP